MAGIGDFIKEAIGPAVGGLASIGNTLIGNHNSAKEARAADQRSYMYWKQQQLEHYPLMRRSLETAGFNPMLALGGGASGASGSFSTHQGQTSVPDLVGSAKDGAELANALFKLWDDEDRQRDAEWMKTRKEQELLSAQIKKLEADTKAVQNTTNISSEREERNSILDWFDSLSPLGLGLGGYWLGKGKKGSPVTSVPPILPMKTPSKIPYGAFMSKVSPYVVPLLSGAVGYKTSKGVVKKFVKDAEEAKKKGSKHNPWMFSPLGGYWAY